MLPDTVTDAYDREIVRQEFEDTIADDMAAYRVWGKHQMYESLNDLRRAYHHDDTHPARRAGYVALAPLRFVTPLILAPFVGALMGAVLIVRFVRRTPEAPSVKLWPLLLYWSGELDSFKDLHEHDAEDDPF